MDGSSSQGGDNFEKAADVFQAATHSMKTAFTPAVGNVQTPTITDGSPQGMIPEQSTGASSHASGAQTTDMVQPGILDSEITVPNEDEKLKKVREEMHQKMHKQTYFYPVFEAKPKHIEQEREEVYKAKDEQKIEEKKQEDFLKASQSEDLFSRQQRVRREGEGSKIGG